MNKVNAFPKEEKYTVAVFLDTFSEREGKKAPYYYILANVIGTEDKTLKYVINRLSNVKAIEKDGNPMFAEDVDEVMFENETKKRIANFPFKF
jgi:hypothetical protein